eukprot:4523-Prymnesium_polylepis.1
MDRVVCAKRVSCGRWCNMLVSTVHVQVEYAVALSPRFRAHAASGRKSLSAPTLASRSRAAGVCVVYGVQPVDSINMCMGHVT